MNLKGYQWVDDKGKVVMTFTFKRLELDIWERVSEEEINKFKEFLKKNGENEILKENHWEKVK